MRSVQHDRKRDAQRGGAGAGGSNVRCAVATLVAAGSQPQMNKVSWSSTFVIKGFLTMSIFTVPLFDPLCLTAFNMGIPFVGPRPVTLTLTLVRLAMVPGGGSDSFPITMPLPTYRAQSESELELQGADPTGYACVKQSQGCT
eukprot:69900-Chlamydomonas_euryale.AAC.1